MAGEKGIRLGDAVLKIGSGATPKGGKEVYLSSGEIALIRSQNIYNDRFSMDGLAWILPEHAEQLNNVEVQENDILLNITGDSVARCCQVPPKILPARVNQHVAIIRPEPSKINPRFLRYFLISPTMQGHMLGIAASGATRNALTKGMIENFIIPPISIGKQKAIADVLSALDDKIELNRQINATLEGIARTLFKDWFIDFGPVKAKAAGQQPPGLDPDISALFPDSLDDEGIPVGWAYAVLGDISQNSTCGVNPTEISPETPYIGLEHMPRQSIALMDWEGAGKVSSNKVSFQRGDFLFGKLRPYFHKVGIAPIDGICSTDIVVVQPKEPCWSSYTIICMSNLDFIFSLPRDNRAHAKYDYLECP